jgi:cyclic beta-1,2-glucan synthetase
VAPLTIGELWAWPSMLKLALIENLRRLAEEMLEAREARGPPTPTWRASTPRAWPRSPPPGWRSTAAYLVRIFSSACASTACACRPCARVEDHLAAQEMTSEDAIRSEHQHQAAAQVSMANVITSLRLCATLDWSHHFEAVSLVERVLQRDPAGVYGSMDFLSATATGRRWRRWPTRPAKPRSASACGRSRAHARRPKPGPRSVALRTSATT